jgi:glycosyltransferase involved in cell wall biosynthesis
MLLAEGLARRGHEVSVMTFYKGLPALEQRLSANGVPVLCLRKRGRWDLLGPCKLLRRTIRAQPPDVVYSFLPTANVVSALVIRPLGHTTIVWGVRASSTDFPGHDWFGKLIARMERWFKAVPDGVICNSRAGLEHLRAIGFQADRLGIAPNIIDIGMYRFTNEARKRFRDNLGLSPSALLLGAAGRLDPMKGIEDLLAALPRIQATAGPVRMLVAGEGARHYSDHLRRIADGLGVARQVHWLGCVDDMQAFYSAVDVFCSASRTEGTSNVLAEALASGRICVTTRVGDSAALVAEQSLMADPGDADSLARAILEAVARLPNWDGDAARSRIAGLLSADSAISVTERLLRQFIGPAAAGTHISN